MVKPPLRTKSIGFKVSEEEYARLETTQIYTQVSIRTLQQVHSATHPSATLEHHAGLQPLPRIAPETPPEGPTTEDLFAALDTESEEESEGKDS